MKIKSVLLILLLFFSFTAFCSNQLTPASKILVELPGGKMGDTESIAIERIREYSKAVVHVEYNTAKSKNRKDFDLTIILGTPGDTPELKEPWQNHISAKDDSYLIQSISTAPLVILASGKNKRAVLYAAYHLSDLIKADADISKLNLFFQPKIAQRYVSYGATTHGRRYYQPALYYKSLKELPRYGYNGVLIYPGGGTPIGRQSSPVAEGDSGNLVTDNANTRQWRNWFAEIKKYGHDIMMTIPPMVPPGYKKKEIQDFYAGGPEPKNYITNLKSHYSEFLKILTHDYPEIDSYLFNSTEGATFGENERFFGAPDTKRFSNKTYLVNNERIMRAYFEVLSDHFKSDLSKVSFWTHSFGLTSEGIAKMREILFQYPKVLILEDDFWNNNLWPFDLPAMAYLPEDLRAKIHSKNPFGMFQIATDGEYYGGGSLPNAYPGSHVRTANDALKRNARLVIQRIDLHDRTPYGTLFGTMEIVPIAASAQLWDPTPDEDQIWQQWANRRFGKHAAPFVIDALQQSHNILMNGLSCNGMDLLAVGSEINPRLWRKDEDGMSRYNLFSKPGRPLLNKTKKDVIYSEEYTVYQMNTHSVSIEKYVNDRNSALKSIETALQKIEQAKPFLDKEDYAMLKNVFINGRNVVEALKLLGQAAYATNIIFSNFDNIKEPDALFNTSIQNIEAFINEKKLITEMNDNLKEIIAGYKKAYNSR